MYDTADIELCILVIFNIGLISLIPLCFYPISIPSTPSNNNSAVGNYLVPNLSFNLTIFKFSFILSSLRTLIKNKEGYS